MVKHFGHTTCLSIQNTPLGQKWLAIQTKAIAAFPIFLGAHVNILFHY